MSLDNSTFVNGDPVYYNQQEYFSQMYYDNSLTYKTIPFYHYCESFANVDEDYHSAICEDCGQTTLHLHDSYLEFVNNGSHAIVCERCNLRQIKPHFKGNPAFCPCRFVHV